MTMNAKNEKAVGVMSKAGAYFGYTKTRRHPSTNPFILTSRNKADIIDPNKITESLEKAKAFVKSLAKDGKKILFVATKPEAKNVLIQSAVGLEMPYVTERWVGGIITNFPEIRKRISRFLELKDDKAKGELVKYTKKERLLLDKEIERLQKYFSGISTLTKIPDAIFVVDSKKEHIAVAEAQKANIPVISISNTDCDIRGITYPIVGNDTSSTSISFFVGEIAKAYLEGKQ